MKQLIVLVLALLLSGCESTELIEEILSGSSSSSGELTDQTIARGLKEALTVGSGRVVDTLGAQGGFLDGAFRIPLPDKLQDAQEVAARFGLSKPFDELEVRMNRAAEAATPKARELFVGAIRQMSFSDVMSIYRGGDDAATQYLRRTTGESLESQMRPVIDNSLEDVGAAQTLESLISRYNALPLVKPIEADLTGYVTGYAEDAIFTRLAAEEADIRRNPVKRTTELLRTVFGS